MEKRKRKGPLVDEIAALKKQQDEMLSLMVGLCGHVGRAMQTAEARPKPGPVARFFMRLGL